MEGKVQHYVKVKKVVNPLTGSPITEETSVKDLSYEKSLINVKRRELEAVEKFIDKLLEPHIVEALENGEDFFQDFWKIQIGNFKFNEKKFYKTATPELIQQYESVKESLESITKDGKFMEAGKPSIRYPKND